MTIFYWIIEYFACFVEATALFCFSDIFIPSNKALKSKLFHIILLSIFTIILNRIKLISIYSTFLIILACWLSQLLLKKKKPLLTLFIALFYMTIIISIDFILFSVLNVTVGIKFFDFSSEFSLYRIGAILAAKTILILLCIFMNRLSDKTQLVERSVNLITGLTSISLIIISTIMYFIQLNQNESVSQIFILSFYIIMLIMIVVIYCSLVFIVKKEKFKQELLLIKQQNILLKKSLQEQEKTFDLWRKSIHDYKHKLLALESMMKSKKYNEVLMNIEAELMLFADKAFYLNTGNNIVDIIINSKMNIAQSYGITITVNAKITNEIKIDDIDLSVILGNLIDNAIEAATKENEEKYVHIQISQIKEMLVIKILNSFSKDEISYESTKNNSELHGIGLKSVKHIVDSYNGNFTIELKDGCVIALVTV